MAWWITHDRQWGLPNVKADGADPRATFALTTGFYRCDYGENGQQTKRTTTRGNGNAFFIVKRRNKTLCALRNSLSLNLWVSQSRDRL